MLIDRSHRTWAVASAAILIVAAAVYAMNAARGVPSGGGSALGLIYGSIGLAFMVFVTLLSVRKKFPIWRIGRAQTWMRGHLWLGALSLPLIMLHAGFLSGHGLTWWLMCLFAIVWASGLAGAWLQHVVPRRMLRDIPMETIYDQIHRVRAQLVDEADMVVADATGRLEIAAPAGPPPGSLIEPSANAGASALATVMRPVEPAADDTGMLREFYVTEMRPFLQKPARSHMLADPGSASGRFEKLRALVPASLQPAIVDLESICEEERQLQQQLRMHRVLHGWLLVHVPLSFALMALALVHVFMALRY